MNIYYILSRDSLSKYNMTNVAAKSVKTIAELQNDIKSITHFCREETSIETAELVSYLDSGITLYALGATNVLAGVLNFDINGAQINILGLCAPEPSVGVGSLLLNAVKTFAEQNAMKNIALTCYGNVVDFYTHPKNGFRITRQMPISADDDSDSDSDSDSDEDSSAPLKMKYDLNYVVDFAGGKKKRRIHTKRIKKTVKKTRKNRKSRKCRKCRK